MINILHDAKLLNAKRIVIKLGSSLLIDDEGKNIRQKWLKSLVSDICDLTKQGINVAIVTSGAVALGSKYIDFKSDNLLLEEKQAAAACGQIDLVGNYQFYFNAKNIQVAQILLTMLDSEIRRNYLNAKNTMDTLIENNVIPIINENDTVATGDLRFGDNDRLSAKVAQMIGAEYLIILSDVDGVYTSNPNIDDNAVHIDRIEKIDAKIEAMAGDAIEDGVGTGGMITKIQAAKISVASGCHMILAKGTDTNPIKKLLNGAKHTLFVSNETPISARKQWIATSLQTKGKIIIDRGAVAALKNGNSLLPAGVIDVDGEFDRGDTVEIQDPSQTQVGVGIVAYSSSEASMIKGHQSSEIKHIVGFSGRNDLIHANDLVILEG